MKLKDLIDVLTLYEKIMIRPVTRYNNDDNYDFVGDIKEFKRSVNYDKLCNREVYTVHATAWNCIAIGIEE